MFKKVILYIQYFFNLFSRKKKKTEIPSKYKPLIRILKERNLFVPFFNAIGNYTNFILFCENFNIIRKFSYDENGDLYYVDSLETFFQKHKSSCIFVSAFQWGSTEEGFDFWSEINKKYRLLLNYNPEVWNLENDEINKLYNF